MAKEDVKLIIGADTSMAEKNISSFIRSAQQSFGGLSTVLGGLTAGYVFDKLIMDTARFGEEMKRMSAVSGLSVESISALKYAAEQSETSFEALASGIKFMSKNMDDLKKSGLVAADVKDSHEALLQLADKFSRMPEGAEKSALALKYLGKSGNEILPFLNEGREGVAKLTEEAKRLGIVMSKDAAEAADDFKDNLGKLEAQSSALKQTIGNALIPELNNLLGMMNKKEWARLGTLLGGKSAEFLMQGGTTGLIAKDFAERLTGKNLSITDEIMSSLFAGGGGSGIASKIFRSAVKGTAPNMKMDEINKSLSEWTGHLNASNPALTEHERKVTALWEDYGKLKDKLTELKAPAEMFAKAQEAMFKGLESLTAKNAFEKLEKDVGRTTKSVKEQVDGLKTWRDQMVTAFDDAISKMDAMRAKAESFRTGAGEIGSFLAGFGAPQQTFEQQRDALKKRFSGMWESEDLGSLTKLFTDTKGFMETNVGARDIFGFSEGFGDMKNNLKDLEFHMEQIAMRADQQGNTWAKAANQQIEAISSVDSWMKYLNDDVKVLEDRLASVKELRIDTSAAQAEIANLTQMVQSLQALISSGGGAQNQLVNAVDNALADKAAMGRSAFKQELTQGTNLKNTGAQYVE